MNSSCCSGGFKGCKCIPLWRLVMYFCVHIAMSTSNDYTAVVCSNNNYAQLHTHISVPYWSPDVFLGLELLRDIQFGLPGIFSLASCCNKYVHLRAKSGRGNPKFFRRASRAICWTPLSKSATVLMCKDSELYCGWLLNIAATLVCLNYSVRDELLIIPQGV